MAQETMLTYPQFDKPFIVYTDASEKQIGGVVTHEGKPLELLAITETLKYFKHMLYGHKIIVKTDHKTLTHQLSTHASD
jgi:ribonuclease HI